MTKVEDIFKQCVQAINGKDFIVREGRADKEYHFQNWFQKRLEALPVDFDIPGRNSYPDYRLVHDPEGYELKGLAYPGREATYDSNSQVPRGEHSGRKIFYVFGRYPAKPDGNMYPVTDLVLCHGSFLNADNEYIHRNKSVRGFGSYGDIMIRDRKMYVAPTPFALAQGTAHHATMILPADHLVEPSLVEVGVLQRREVDDLVVAYDFDLRTNELSIKTVPNPNAGRLHDFKAYRVIGDPQDAVSLRAPAEILDDLTATVSTLDDDEETRDGSSTCLHLE